MIDLGQEQQLKTVDARKYTRYSYRGRDNEPNATDCRNEKNEHHFTWTKKTGFANTRLRTAGDKVCRMWLLACSEKKKEGPPSGRRYQTTGCNPGVSVPPDGEPPPKRKPERRSGHKRASMLTFSVFFTSSANDMNSFHSFLLPTARGAERKRRWRWRRR